MAQPWTLSIVAAGTVVEVVRDLPNVTPGKNPDGLTIAQIAGNRVIIDMGSGHYAMYAHLAPGSIQLHVGDTCGRGRSSDCWGTRAIPALRIFIFR